MRRSPEVSILRTDDGMAIGVFMKADYTAEHEWGIARLGRHLQFPAEPKLGIAGRKMTAGLPDEPRYFIYKTGVKIKKSSVDILYCGTMFSYGREPDREDYQHLSSQRWGDEESITGQWNEESFSLTAYSHDAKKLLKDLRDSLLAGDIGAWVGGATGNPFDRGGLVIMRASQIGKEEREIMLNSDIDAANLKKAAEDTGIEARLAEQVAKARERYLSDYTTYALSPKWVGEMSDAEKRPYKDRTSHPVIFFLNPCKQDKYNFGWFTVEELDEWIAGKGPVIKGKNAAS